MSQHDLGQVLELQINSPLVYALNISGLEVIVTAPVDQY